MSRRTKAPAFMMYPGDFLSDGKVVAMSAEELGVYTRLLMHDWKENGLPNDPKTLAEWGRVSVRRFETIWRKVQSCFELHTNGRWYNPRLRVERRRQREWRRKSAVGGKLGARARWKKQGKGGHQMVMRKNDLSLAVSSSTSNPPLVPPARADSGELRGGEPTLAGAVAERVMDDLRTRLVS